jgi:hypothetical protein
VLRQEAQVLAHLGRAGRAVHADDVDAERLERASAAPISEPSSIVPVSSTVTCAISTTPVPVGGHGALGADDGRP